MANSTTTPAGEQGSDSPAEIEPDYRFTLANERTFLAWQRTSLGLLAAAVAVVQLVPELAIPGARRALGVLLAALAILTSDGAAALAAGRSRHATRPAVAPPPHTGLPSSGSHRGRGHRARVGHRQGGHGLSPSRVAGPRPERGLQPERTMLAWTRTSFALLANGALLTIKNLHGAARAAAADPGGLGRRGRGMHVHDRFATPTNPRAAPDPRTHHSPPPGVHRRDSRAGAHRRDSGCPTTLVKQAASSVVFPIIGELAPDDLQGDGSADLVVIRLVDFAHSPLPRTPVMVYLPNVVPTRHSSAAMTTSAAAIAVSLQRSFTVTSRLGLCRSGTPLSRW